MFDHFKHGLFLLISPRRTWRAIGESPYAPAGLLLYTMMLASVAFLCRVAGSVFLGTPWAGLEGMLFTLICLGVTLTNGLLLIPCARFARRPVNDGHAIKLAVMSATPVWLMGVFQVIPLGPLRSVALLVSLTWGSALLFAGLPNVFGTEPVPTVVVSLLVSAFWVIGVVVSVEGFLRLAFLV